MSSPAAADARPMPVGWVLFGLSLSILLCNLDTNIVNVGLPTLMQAFHVSFATVQWVVLSYLVVVTATLVGVGRLGDLFGRRRLYLAGLATFTVASAACGLAPTFAMLLVARGIQGLGAAVLLSLAFAFVTEVVPAHRTGSAIGLLSTMGSLGTMLGPTAGGLAITTLGWRSMFWLNVPLCLVSFELARRNLPRTSSAPKGTFDVRGTIVLALTLTAYALGMTFSQAHGFGDRVVLALFTGAALGVVGFVALQRRTASPLLPITMFRDVVFSTSLAMTVLSMTLMMASLVLGPFFLSRAVGLPMREVGAILSLGPLFAVVMSVPAGRMVDRVGARPTSLLGLGSITLGVLTLSQLTLAHPRGHYVLGIVFMSLGHAFFQTPNNTAVMMAAPADRRGVVSSLLALGRNLGGITGASLMGALFARALPVTVAVASPEALTQAMRATFRVGTAMGVLAFALGVFTWRRGTRAGVVGYRVA